MIRTRFAPSPTGFLHIGGLRTALYNYLFARKNKGIFILRIEDTDQKRFVEGAIESLLKTLEQIGLEYDEGPEKNGDFGPYIQSERTEIYRKYVQELIEKKAAYFCFCTAERLESMREQQIAAKKAPMYDRTCLKLSETEIEEQKKSGKPFVIRQKIPHGRFLKFKDLIRGNVSFETSTIDDQVLMKSDNFPTYHLANVVDDHLMEITHVIRGEEWLPSTPKHILLYESFGWKNPEFAHIPLLLNKDKTKLSKRQNDVSVEDYLAKGYGKEAIINFIALLGWHPGSGEEKEIFSLVELIENFSLEKVHKSGAIFDIEKLNWFNFEWNRKMYQEKMKGLENDRSKMEQKKAELLLELCQKYLPTEWLNQEKLLSKALITVEEKILKMPKEAPLHLALYFEQKEATKELLCNEKMKVDETMAKKALEEGLKSLENFEGFESLELLKEHLLKLAVTLGVKNGQLLWPLRAALSGEAFSPGTFELLWALGKEESTKRIKKALLLTS